MNNKESFNQPKFESLSLEQWEKDFAERKKRLLKEHLKLRKDVIKADKKWTNIYFFIIFLELLLLIPLFYYKIYFSAGFCTCSVVYTFLVLIPNHKRQCKDLCEKVNDRISKLKEI